MEKCQLKNLINNKIDIVSDYILFFPKPSTTETLKVWKKPVDIFHISYRHIFYINCQKKDLMKFLNELNTKHESIKF